MRGVYLKNSNGNEVCLSKEVEVIMAFMEISKYVYELTYRIELKGDELLSFLNSKNFKVETNFVIPNETYEITTYDW